MRNNKPKKERNLSVNFRRRPHDADTKYNVNETVTFWCLNASRSDKYETKWYRYRVHSAYRDDFCQHSFALASCLQGWHVPFNGLSF